MERSPAPFDAFVASLPFAPSAYQRQVLEAMSHPSQSVVVVAPTGSGKSVLADAAIWQALERGGAAAYTSPLRALANQRFEQMTARWGERVGLATGDSTIRPHAPARVLTTEVYRLMALLPEEVAAGQREYMRRLQWTIFDEAQYLADPERGSVWEEAILATPPQTRILCLSATIGVPERLVGWLRWLGRDVVLVETTVRPVPLRHMLALKGDLHLVMDEHGRRAQTFPFAGGWALAQRQARRPSGHPRGRRGPAPPASVVPTVPPNEWVRTEAIRAVELLRERALVPAIVFASGRREAEMLAQTARDAFPEAAAGVAFHHAGLPPEERRSVEEALRRGDLWLVCSTTTLAAGLDVPARSVLVTSFGHFDGTSFSLFTPAEFRQLVGRAGRLGKDESGTAVLLASPWHSFEEAFRKLTTTLPPIESAFRPSYATALAWWSGRAFGTEDASDSSQHASLQRLATALSRTFSAYLRRSRGGKTSPGTNEPDSASLQGARVLGRLLVDDELATEAGELTPRGRFVLHVSGGSEGRLLLRLIESGAFAALPTDQQEGLLALLADESPATAASVDEPVLAMYLEAQREQLAAERRAGTSVTVPLQPVMKFGGQGATGRQGIDLWRRRAAVQDFLERANRAASRARLALPLPAV